MSTSRVALIIIGTFRDAWWKLSAAQQKDFFSRVGTTATAAGIEPITGYRLTSTPGAFLEVWEGADHATVDRAVEDFRAMDYARYIDARWLIGERGRVKSPQRAQRTQRKK